MSLQKQKYSFRYKRKKGKLWLQATGSNKRNLQQTRTYIKSKGSRVERIKKIKKPYWA